MAEPIEKGWRRRPEVLYPAGAILLSAVCALLGLILIDHPLNTYVAPYLYGTDWTSYMHGIEMIRMFWHSGSGMSGYNPWFMAGYPFAHYTSGQTLVFLGVILSNLTPAAVGALHLAASAAVFPAAGYISLRILGGERSQALTGSVLATMFGLLCTPLYFNWMGLCEAATGVAVVFLTCAYLFRFMEEGRFRHWAGLTVCLIAAVLLHKTAPVALVLVGIPVVIFYRRGKRIGAAALAAVIAIGANLFWLYPFLSHLEYLDPQPHYHWGEKEHLLPFTDFFDPGSLLGSLPVAWLLLVGTIFGWRILRERRKKRADAWFGGQILILALAYLGPLLGLLNVIQPRRFSSYFFVLAIYPVSLACVHYGRRLKPWKAGAVAAAFVALVLIAPNAYKRAYPAKIMTTLPPRSQAVVNWIEENTDRRARIMMEEVSDAGSPDNPYGGFYLNSVIPYMLKREVIGGSYPGVDVLHHRVTFLEGKILLKPVHEMSEVELEDILSRYNVGWVISFSPKAKKRFDRADTLMERMAEFGPIVAYEVSLPKSFFLVGKGAARAFNDRIKVKVHEEENGAVVLKYHWVDYLKASPSGKVEKYSVKGDPIGFIKVVNPPKEFMVGKL